MPIQLGLDRDALILEIRGAFKEVTLGSGNPWNLLRHQATSWMALAENPDWKPNLSPDAWYLLDSVGFRFYLPAAMIRSARNHPVGNLQDALSLPLYGDPESASQRWSGLDRMQRECVRHFLKFKIDWATEMGDVVQEETWQEALESAWITQ